MQNSKQVLLSYSVLKDLNILLNGPIAQLWLERTPDKREVGGSSPLRPTILGL